MTAISVMANTIVRDGVPYSYVFYSNRFRRIHYAYRVAIVSDAILNSALKEMRIPWRFTMFPLSSPGISGAEMCF